MPENEFETALAVIEADRVHGASELARAALEALASAACNSPRDTAADLLADLDENARRLADARPSMTPLLTLTARYCESLKALHAKPVSEAKAGAVEAADALIAESRRAGDETARNAADLIGSGHTVFTHSVSSTVRAALALLHERGPLKVIVTESRPLNEGQPFARALAGSGIDTVLITDAQANLFVREADAVLVGADTVLADGGIVNKAGTSLISLAAREADVPVYVAAESFKRRPANAGMPTFEEMSPEELGVTQSDDLAGHLHVRNVYFDVTPARLVAAWIDENGVRRKGDAHGRA